MNMLKAIVPIAVCVSLSCVTAFSTAFANPIAPDQVKMGDGSVKAALTSKSGDPIAGRKWFANRKLGNCLACHVNKKMPEQPFHGEIGPSMDGIAGRYSVAELRAILVNSKAVFGEQTIMPGFYQIDPGQRTAKKFKGKTILSAQQVEDILAYLLTLKD